jgi:hypothetical protein
MDVCHQKSNSDNCNRSSDPCKVSPFIRKMLLDVI